MKSRRKTAVKTEFGDWQTPGELAALVCATVSRRIQPASVFEPNCGEGTFLRAAIHTFPTVRRILGLEVNHDYVLRSQSISHASLNVIHGDFFDYQWTKDIKQLPDPLLVLGNPPWVTNSDLMRLRSGNLPPKSNVNGVRGIDAITGKSNFDISEWMLIKEVEALQGRDAALAMLCKTSTARKVIAHAWKNSLSFSSAEIREIDARRYFGVSVAACLLLVRFAPGLNETDGLCTVYPSLDATDQKYVLGKRNGKLVADADVFDRHSRLISSTPSHFNWRSGIKHDCAKVMELIILPDGTLLNGFGESVDIEREVLYPMLKSSDLANGEVKTPRRMMLVTQRSVGSETSYLESTCPRAWRYLVEHADRLAKRGSSIYNNRPRFSIFGVGEYSFKPWKVAISGLYRKLSFRVVGPHDGRPVVLDDTCYFIGCESEEEACLICELLESQVCHEILDACIFWESKRPITKDVLNTINIPAVAHHLGIIESLKIVCPRVFSSVQTTLF